MLSSHFEFLLHVLKTSRKNPPLDIEWYKAFDKIFDDYDITAAYTCIRDMKMKLHVPIEGLKINSLTLKSFIRS